MKTETVQTIHYAIAYFGLAVSLCLLLAAGVALVWIILTSVFERWKKRTDAVRLWVSVVRNRKSYEQFAEVHDAMRGAMLSHCQFLQAEGWDETEPQAYGIGKRELYDNLYNAIPDKALNLHN